MTEAELKKRRDKYGMLIVTIDDGERYFIVFDPYYIFREEETARAEMNRLNAEWRKEQNND